MKVISNETESLKGPTYYLLITNCIVYLLLSIVALNPITPRSWLTVLLAQNTHLFLMGCIWQPFTALFVHFSIMHIIGNLIFLAIFGYRLEDFADTKDYMIIYIGSGLVGNAFSLLIFAGENDLSGGASGAVFGLLGGVIVYLKHETSNSWKGLLGVGLILLLLSAGLNVNVFAHVLGFLSGIGIANHLYKRSKKLEKTQQI